MGRAALIVSTLTSLGTHISGHTSAEIGWNGVRVPMIKEGAAS
jgi:hypothetical protein